MAGAEGFEPSALGFGVPGQHPTSVDEVPGEFKQSIEVDANRPAWLNLWLYSDWPQPERSGQPGQDYRQERGSGRSSGVPF